MSILIFLKIMDLAGVSRYIRSMKTVYSEKHGLHAPKHEYGCGKMIEYFEKPERVGFIHDEIKNRHLGGIQAPETFPLAKILRVHDQDYVDFLQRAHADWRARGYEGDAFSGYYPVNHPGARPVKNIHGRMGIYTADGCAPLTATSWEAIESSAHVALTAQKIVASGQQAAFALCRPPGHHATASCASGYCYLNNAAIAAQAFRDDGAVRVAVLDVDYHHGNGTQDIFYNRDDVLCVSIHADPDVDFPYFAGHADETGTGKGEGYNFNFPLPHGAIWDSYAETLEKALGAIEKFGAEALVISLGVDTFEGDPISKFKLKSDDYFKIGRAIRRLDKPTLFVMEGGYAIQEIGVNTVNVLESFLQG